MIAILLSQLNDINSYLLKRPYTKTHEHTQNGKIHF